MNFFLSGRCLSKLGFFDRSFLHRGLLLPIIDLLGSRVFRLIMLRAVFILGGTVDLLSLVCLMRFLIVWLLLLHILLAIVVVILLTVGLVLLLRGDHLRDMIFFLGDLDLVEWIVLWGLWWLD